MSVSTLLTEQQFLDLPDYPGRQEFRDGELIELPFATYAHSELIKRIVALLESTLHKSRIWSETGFRLRPNRWVVPDVAVIWPDQRRSEGYFQGSPLVAMEVASRGNTPDQLQQKVIDHLESGVSEVLIIYPKSRTMMVHRPPTSGLQPRILHRSRRELCLRIGQQPVFTPEYRTAVE